MYPPPNVGDVACPKCEAASGTPCLYVYNWQNKKKMKVFRRVRTGEPMYHVYHVARYAKFRELRDTGAAQRVALSAWLFLHGDIFKEDERG